MKKAIFTNEEHSYDYEEVDGNHILYHSNTEFWNSNVRNKILLSIYDSGNGLEFKFKYTNRKCGKLDYSQCIELEILLRLINKNYEYFIADKIKF
jgi:hypothetical protein